MRRQRESTCAPLKRQRRGLTPPFKAVANRRRQAPKVITEDEWGAIKDQVGAIEECSLEVPEGVLEGETCFAGGRF